MDALSQHLSRPWLRFYPPGVPVVVSYEGKLQYCFPGDRDLARTWNVFAACLGEAFEELRAQPRGEGA
jgi:hypothetical protein